MRGGTNRGQVFVKLDWRKFFKAISFLLLLLYCPQYFYYCHQCFLFNCINSLSGNFVVVLSVHWCSHISVSGLLIKYVKLILKDKSICTNIYVDMDKERNITTIIIIINILYWLSVSRNWSSANSARTLMLHANTNFV